jgi:hypothetical protein
MRYNTSPEEHSGREVYVKVSILSIAKIKSE